METHHSFEMSVGTYCMACPHIPEVSNIQRLHYILNHTPYNLMFAINQA